MPFWMSHRTVTRVKLNGHDAALFVWFMLNAQNCPCIRKQLMKTSTTNGRHLFHGLDRGVGKTVCQHSGVSILQLICQSFLRWHNIFTAISSLPCKLFTYTLSAKTLFTTQTFNRKNRRTPDYFTKFVRIC